MTEKIRLAGHTALLKASSVYKACKPLFEKTSITYFCYLRRYKNNSFTFLPSMVDFGSYLFEDGVYPDSWFAGLPFDELKSGRIYWDIAKQICSGGTNEIGKVVTRDFNLPIGIEFIEKNESYCEFYCFSGNSADIYSIPVPYLYEFLYYFKQVCHPLLLEAYENRLYLYDQSFRLAQNPVINIETDKYEKKEAAFDVKRYYLTGKYDGAFLTRREVEVLRRMKEGGAVKGLADSLYISTRTLEHHITNIKEKLNVSRVTEMLHIASSQKILL